MNTLMKHILTFGRKRDIAKTAGIVHLTHVRAKRAKTWPSYLTSASIIAFVVAIVAGIPHPLPVLGATGLGIGAGGVIAQRAALRRKAAAPQVLSRELNAVFHDCHPDVTLMSKLQHEKHINRPIRVEVSSEGYKLKRSTNNTHD
ncbi:MAG: hypothetical protein V4490_06790 [Pseudomonadota bacterium]